jgi:cytosine/adenosine deaminase-related metal-dependent hydrolase
MEVPGKGGLARAASISPLADGAVAVGTTGLRSVGRFKDLRRAYATATVIDHEGAVLLPSMVNGHAHLELAVLEEAAPAEAGSRPAGAFPDWIRALLDRLGTWRAAVGADWEARMVAAGRKALAAQYESGVDTVIDVGNSTASAAIGANGPVRTRFFIEMLGLSGASQKEALQRLARHIPAELACTPHAPYSCGPELLQALKKRARVAGRPLTIHAAESAAEVEFLRHGTGPFRSFLAERGVLDDSFEVPGCGAVQYLDRLGLLDRQTLCVHCVHLVDEEITMLAARGSALCLCPGSNRHLSVGKAPVEKLLAAGIPLLLGTDSAASNPMLSMWREMRLLREDHPGLHPGRVLAMAAGTGAHGVVSNLHLSYLAVRPAAGAALPEGESLLEWLTVEGETATVTRIE